MSYMDERNLPQDPGEPGHVPVQGEGGAVSSAAGLPSSPLATEILASDLQKLMGVVEAAVALYNEMESRGTFYHWSEYRGLDDALAQMGLEEI